LVVIGEHLSNQAYQYALISPRYYPLLLIVTAKNAGLLLYLLYRALIVRHDFDLPMVMQAWAIGAVIGTASLGLLWWVRRDAAPLNTRFHFGNEVLSQHRASLVHFLIGLLAILILQYDRLAVGGLLTLSQTGLYFRHTLLVSLCYQAFNIVSFNRITPSVYAAAKTKKVDYLRGMVLREYLKTLVGTPLLLLLIWFADVLTHGAYSRRFHLTIALMGLLLIGFMLRAAADFPAMIMNAYHQERLVLQRQGTAFVVGAALLILLTWRFGVWGAASASICTNGLYAALNWQVLGHLPKAIALRPPPGGATPAIGAPI
jgi:O-antigen/teichoic acid export membrane protein